MKKKMHCSSHNQPCQVYHPSTCRYVQQIISKPSDLYSAVAAHYFPNQNIKY